MHLVYNIHSEAADWTLSAPPALQRHLQLLHMDWMDLACPYSKVAEPCGPLPWTTLAQQVRNACCPGKSDINAVVPDINATGVMPTSVPEAQSALDLMSACPPLP